MDAVAEGADDEDVKDVEEDAVDEEEAALRYLIRVGASFVGVEGDAAAADAEKHVRRSRTAATDLRCRRDVCCVWTMSCGDWRRGRDEEDGARVGSVLIARCNVRGERV